MTAKSHPRRPFIGEWRLVEMAYGTVRILTCSVPHPSHLIGAARAR